MPTTPKEGTRPSRQRVSDTAAETKPIEREIKPGDVVVVVYPFGPKGDKIEIHKVSILPHGRRWFDSCEIDSVRRLSYRHVDWIDWFLTAVWRANNGQ